MRGKCKRVIRGKMGDVRVVEGVSAGSMRS